MSSDSAQQSLPSPASGVSSSTPPVLGPVPSPPDEVSRAPGRVNGSRRGNAGTEPCGQSRRRRNVISSDWMLYRNVLIFLKDLPQDATTWQVWSNLRPYGNIIYIDLDEPRINRSRVARVRFEPPPSPRIFEHDNHIRLDFKGKTVLAEIWFERHRADNGACRTPLGNRCPSSVTIPSRSLTFGISTSPGTIMPMRQIDSVSALFNRSLLAEIGIPIKPEQVDQRLTFDFERMKLTVNFTLYNTDLKARKDGSAGKEFKMVIRFTALARNRVHRVDLPDGKWALAIILDEPPLFWKKRTDIRKTHVDDRLVWAENDIWCRAVDVTEKPDITTLQPVSLHDDNQAMNIGRWTSYWFEMGEADRQNWSVIEAGLRDWNIKTKTDTNFQLTRPVKSQLWDMLDSNIGGESDTAKSQPASSNLALLIGSAAHLEFPFDVRYQLEVCISHGVLNEYNITRQFLEKLLQFSAPGRRGWNRARLILEYAADRGTRIYDPMSLFSDKAALAYYPNTTEVPDHCALVRKVTVTPTHIYFNTPTVETTNRVLRQYKNVQDNFIRVQFTDELAWGRIEGTDADRDDAVYVRVYRALTRGIRMGPWHWQFLAFGNSQIRENSAFFFCQSGGNAQDAITCGMIRKWMGRFGHIRVIAKYAARLGQCFSTTRLLRGISTPRIVTIPDFQHGKYCFTDGVGKVSSLVAQMIAQDWQLTNPPSAYQFRMGGCKGVLVVWPDVKGLYVHIRKSQEKFAAEFNGLEVIRCSQFSSATLNRQTITILLCLGVPKRVFTDMTTEQLRQYNLAMTDRKVAHQLLTQFVDENQMTLEIAQMVASFMESREPFVRSLLHLWKSWSMKALKEKARLMVEEGAFVLGCADETATLRGYSKSMDGQTELRQDLLPQIFLQVPDRKTPGCYKVITGICLVGRNPSLHPGDIRVVEAVDVPALRHIRDVVVFPVKGDRDIPSMCSGGDLDGDDFFVIWDKSLLPPQWSYPPMDYTPPAAEEQATAPTLNNLQSFFVLYMKNNTLPLIAHAHLGHADEAAEGAKSAKCLELAELHSQAVDYVKTGVPAQWDKALSPRRWPHWMEKRRTTYHSNTALGAIYDLVGRTDFMPTYDMPFDKRILTRYKLELDILKKARQIKSRYDTSMRRVMGQMEIDTEFEVWSTFVLSKPRVGSAYKLQETVGRESAALKQQYQDLCRKEAGSADADSLQRFVAAMYQVTWEEVQIALRQSQKPYVRPNGTMGKRKPNPKSMPLISFPWLFQKMLGLIATGETETSGSVGPSGKAQAKKKPLLLYDELPDAFTSDDDHFTSTEDGQIIHRGEVLNLFHHDDDDDDDDEYFDDSDEIVLDPPSEPDPASVSEKGPLLLAIDEEESQEVKSEDTATIVALSERVKDDLMLLADLADQSNQKSEEKKVPTTAATMAGKENGEGYLIDFSTQEPDSISTVGGINGQSSPDLFDPFSELTLGPRDTGENLGQEKQGQATAEMPAIARQPAPLTAQNLGELQAGMDTASSAAVGEQREVLLIDIASSFEDSRTYVPEQKGVASGDGPAGYTATNQTAIETSGVAAGSHAEGHAGLILDLIDNYAVKPVNEPHVLPVPLVNTMLPSSEPEAPVPLKENSAMALLMEVFGTNDVDGLNAEGQATAKEQSMTAGNAADFTDSSAAQLTPDKFDSGGSESGGSEFGVEIILMRDEPSALERAARLLSS